MPEDHGSLVGKGRRIRKLRVWFSGNIDRRNRECHRDQYTGCDLWEATVTLPPLTFAKPKVTSTRKLHAPGNGAAWFPAVARSNAGHTVLAWNHTRAGQGSVEARNDVYFTGWGTAGSSVKQSGARFPAVTSDGKIIGFTRYTGKDGEVMAVIPGPQVGIANFGEGSDQEFLGTKCVVYQGPAGTDAPRSTCQEDTAGYYCGHPSLPSGGRTVTCSQPTEGSEGLYAIPVNGQGVIDFAARTNFMHLSRAYYEAHGLSDCERHVEAYSSWGDTSDILLVTVLCMSPAAGDDTTTETTTSSRLFLVRHGPRGVVGEAHVSDLSAAIEDFEGADPGSLQFCTGDFLTE